MGRAAEVTGPLGVPIWGGTGAGRKDPRLCTRGEVLYTGTIFTLSSGSRRPVRTWGDAECGVRALGTRLNGTCPLPGPNRMVFGPMINSVKTEWETGCVAAIANVHVISRTSKRKL